MDRRTFLGTLLSIAAGAGCVGSGTNSTPSSEDVINYEELPTDAQNEFVVAMEQNGVKQCDIALLDINESIVKYKGEYYTYAVQSGPSGGATSECDKNFLNVEEAEEFS